MVELRIALLPLLFAQRLVGFFKSSDDGSHCIGDDADYAAAAAAADAAADDDDAGDDGVSMSLIFRRWRELEVEAALLQKGLNSRQPQP